ncbi:flagellar biosynthetic protein FliO [Hydrogenophaga sp.]|uniref:FliO/MopB family protein n=1 Tax=Hydrogenophaga sp. TaxID=1904254 RepID=UPI0026189215|nr:flagellar biosynthetic protein FliO [Hydrogenophaga sp.]MCW5654299.1 flagellar biosynthetic protein FliO [Hydrogenophaga sp.]
MFQNAIPAMLLLALMVGIAFALKWARGRLPGVAGGGNGPALRVLSSLSLGPQQRVVTVQVGQGHDRVCLVLGVAPGSVSALHQMPLPAEAGTPDTDATPGATGFAARLSQLTRPTDAR